MKTIVINTSKALKKTELDVLFKAPYNPEELVWYDEELNNVSLLSDEIKMLLTQGDVVVTSYNLFIIVDITAFPYAQITQYAELYQKFLKKYIVSELLDVLGGKYHILPRKANICFLNDETIADTVVEGRHHEVFVRFLEDAFGWIDIDRWNNIKWTLRYSVNEEVYLDFSKTFSRIKDAQHSDAANPFEILKKQVSEALDDEVKYGQCVVETFFFMINHNNEAELFSDFFVFLYNVFRWIKNNSTDEFKQYSREEISNLMTSGLRKCDYYTQEENYKNVKFFPLLNVINASDSSIKKKWEEKRKTVLNLYRVSEPTLKSMDANVKDSKQAKTRYGIAARFAKIRDAILRNYDSVILTEENKKIIISNIDKTQFFRKNVGEKDFKEILKNSFDDKNNKVKLREYFEYAEFGEDSYNELVSKITQAEIDFFGNDNIIEEVKKAQADFDNLTRKGKWGLISFIGGILSFFAAMYPFLEIRSNIKLYGEVNFLFILPVVGVAAALYALSSGIYTAYIHRKKSEIIHTLEDLKKKSEMAREKSKEAFVEFCEKTLPEAELYLFISRELKYRDEENAKTSKRLNNHIKRFEHLRDLINGFITKMRIGYIEGNNKNNAEANYPAIDVEKGFYDENNAKAYCIIDFDEKEAAGEEEV